MTMTFQNELRERGDIKVFRLGADEDELVVVFTEDYRSHVQCAMTEINIPKEITGILLTLFINILGYKMRLLVKRGRLEFLLLFLSQIV